MSNKHRTTIFFICTTIICVIAIAGLLSIRYENISVIVSSEQPFIFRGGWTNGQWCNPIEFMDGDIQYEFNPEDGTYFCEASEAIELSMPENSNAILVFNTGNDYGEVNISSLYGDMTQNLNSNEGEMQVDISSISNVSEKLSITYNQRYCLVVLVLFIYMVVTSILCGKSEPQKQYGNRAGFIEVQRYLFTILIALHHMYGNPSGAYLGVDFFFIVSGVFLYDSYIKNNTEQKMNNWKFIFSRYKRFVLPYFIAMILGMLIKSAMGFEMKIQKLYDMFFEITMSTGVGFTGNLIIGPGWYMGALLFATLVVYTAMYFGEEKFISIFPIIGIVLISFVYHEYGNLNAYSQDTFILHSGTYRAIAEVGFGSAIGYYLKKNNPKKISTKFKTIVIVIATILSYCIMFDNQRTNNDVIFVALTVLICAWGLQKNEYLEFVFNNKICYFLGKISLNVFLIHVAFLSFPWGSIRGFSAGKVIYVCVITAFSIALTFYNETVSQMLHFKE